MKRIITENGPNGKSRILVDEVVSDHQLIWETTSRNWLGEEPVEREHTLVFPEGHTITRSIAIPPDRLMAEYLKAGIPGLDEAGFHRTGTIDYVVLLEGKLILELDEGSAELAPGDIVVQRDTSHAWRNPLDTPARCLVVASRPEG